ncbi:MAG: cytochrome P450 [Mycobacteriales bacterium]
MTSVEGDRLLGPNVLREPYQYWARLRDGAPVHFVDEGIGYVVVPRYEDVVTALRDADTFSNDLGRHFPAGMSAYEDSPAVQEVLAEGCPYVDALSFSDGEVHARHRRIGRRPFSSRHVRQLEEIITTTVRDLVAALPREQPVDLVTEFAVKLPIIVIGHVLGVEPERAEDVKRWADAQVARLGEPLEDESENLRLARDLVEQHQYLYEQIRDRRANPRDDFLSDLVNSGDVSTDDELVMISAQLIVAGAETTASLIASMVDQLLAVPRSIERLRAHQELVPHMVEETLRLEAPIKLVHRIAVHDVELGGTLIPGDTVVLLLLGSANRDERFVTDPDSFLPERGADARHVAFGLGVHLCLGASLARAEGRIALEGLLAGTGSIARADGAPLQHRSSLTVRALERLPVVLTGAGDA